MAYLPPWCPVFAAARAALETAMLGKSDGTSATHTDDHAPSPYAVTTPRHGAVPTFFYDNGTIIPFARIALVQPRFSGYEGDPLEVDVTLEIGSTTITVAITGDDALNHFYRDYTLYLASCSPTSSPLGTARPPRAP